MNDERGEWTSEKLPAGWEWAPFRLVFEDVTDSVRKLPQKDYAQSGAFPVVDQGEGFVGGYTDNQALVHPAQPPFVVFGDHTRCVKYVDFPFVQGADGIKVLKPKKGINPRYGYYALRAITLPDKGYSRHIKFLRASLFPICSLADQHGIVDKLDSLLGRSKTGREELDHIPKLVDQYKKAVLAGAFRGELTEDIRRDLGRGSAAAALDAVRKARGSAKLEKRRAEALRLLRRPSSSLPELPAGWNWVCVEELASDQPRSIQSGPFGSSLLHSEFVEEGRLVIGIDNVQDGAFAPGSQNRISEQKFHELERFEARPRDVLITVMATIGRCCVVPDTIEQAIITKHVYRITVEPRLIDPYYLMNALRGCEAVLEQMGANVRGQTRPGINGTILKAIFVPLPTLREQTHIIARLDSAMTSVATKEREAGHARKLLDRLDQAVLAKAFSGELFAPNAIADLQAAMAAE